MHDGFGYRDMNTDDSRILEFADGLSVVIVHEAGIPVGNRQLVLLKVQLIILLCERQTKKRFVMSRSFQMKNAYNGINC